MLEEIWKGEEEDLNRHHRSDGYRNVLLVVDMAEAHVACQLVE